jgi:hypothetical protein
MSSNQPQLKKPSYPISSKLFEYLERFDRISKVPITYDDLLRFSGAINVFDNNDIDTLWIRVYYTEFERAEIDLSLKKIYSLLHSDGNIEILKYLNVDAIDYCTFGNSKPFRIKIRNILNDNYVHFYVKKADASRIYGLELEHILSSDKINFLVYQDTLIEEHIIGIPGDVFMEKSLHKCNETEKSQIAKEFVKFNERCMIRLLGDMRAYNYVVLPIHDFDQIVYKIRPIDFDQQCYEGDFKMYRPQFFKENNPMIELIKSKLESTSIDQYKQEERAALAKRIHSAGTRIQKIINIMVDETLAPEKHIIKLKTELYKLTNDENFNQSSTMGHILKSGFEYVMKKYQNSNVLK